MDITVVIPTYNRFEVLQRALKSVMAQTYQTKEIIVVDDGSTDNTSQITNLFPNVQYYYQKNSGVSSARNLGIEKSTCKWIAFLDSDDEWMENKLALHVEFHKANSNILMSYTDEKWIRDSKEVKIPKKFHKFGGDIFDKCLSHCIIAPSATLLHVVLLKELGDFDESLEVCEDYDLWLRITCKHKIGFINKKLITKYGGDEDQLSTKHWGMDRFRVKALEKLMDLELPIETKTIVKKTLVKKYELLFKGALKYDKISEIKEYKNKIERYQI
ncbi:glycosyltransferase family 2 protein [Sulfurimonas sp.]|nr:glycosyltransferase family 2 protein [Sulfurimonas sp.]